MKNLEEKMKKIVCFLLLTALMVGCVSVGSASLNATYRDGKIYVTNSGSGITRINMNGASTGYYLGGSNNTVVLTPPAGATSVTISGVVDPAFGGDGGSVTVQIGGGSYPPVVQPTQAPAQPTQAPGQPYYPPVVQPTQAPSQPSGGPAVYAGNYVNGTVTVSVSGVDTVSAIFVDGVPTGVAIEGAGSKAVKVGNLTPGSHTVELHTFTGILTTSFNVSAQPVVTSTPAVHEHSWGGWNTVKSASCEGAGEQTRTCLICGQTETKRLAPFGHRYVVESANDRYINYRCSNCGKHKQEQKMVYATPTPAVAPLATMSPNLTSGVSAVDRNKYGRILWDSSALAVDYDAYRDVQDANTVIIEVAQDTRTGKPTEISLYMDGDLQTTLRNEGYTTVRFINGAAILNIAMANVNDAWFTTDENINFRVFTTDPNAAGGTMVKVEAELASGSMVQPTATLTGLVLKGATDILVGQNGVYDISR